MRWRCEAGERLLVGRGAGVVGGGDFGGRVAGAGAGAGRALKVGWGAEESPGERRGGNGNEYRVRLRGREGIGLWRGLRRRAQLTGLR